MSAHGSKKVIYAALAGNGLIAITKFAASAMTGSSAMLSEAIHSVVDTGNQGLLLYGIKPVKSAAGPDTPLRLRHGALFLDLRSGDPNLRRRRRDLGL